MIVEQTLNLFSHQVEEQYMEDALRAKEREKEERRRAEKLEETLRNTSYTGQQERYCTYILYIHSCLNSCLC